MRSTVTLLWGQESNLILVKYKNKYQNLCTVVKIHQKKSHKELVVTELALNFSVQKSSPIANAFLLYSLRFPMELPRMQVAPLPLSLGDTKLLSIA